MAGPGNERRRATHGGVKLYPARRSKRRDKSHDVARERDASPTGEVDELTLHMSISQLESLTEDKKENLRSIQRQENPQLHWWERQWKVPSAETWFLETPVESDRRLQAWDDLNRDLVQYADPIPDGLAFVTGIAHFNPQGAPIVDVVRAIHTKKMHYLTKVQESMKDAKRSSELLKFMTCYPDTSPASGGYTRLNPKGWDWLQVLGLSDWPDFVKHIVAQHAGEARMVGDCWWEDLVEMTPQWDKDDIRVSDGLEIARNPCFWHHQFMTTTETRLWMAERQGEGESR